MNVLQIQPNDKLLIIAPHPDDECIGAGGILALYPSQCSVLVMTDGSRADNTVLPEKMKEIRKQEFSNEMRFLGITHYKMMGFPDGELVRYSSCYDEVDFSQYTKVFFPSVVDRHPDHTFSHVYALQKIAQQQISDIDIYEYEIHIPFQEASHYLDITGTIGKKIRAIQCHKSQMAIRDYASQAKALSAYRACQNKHPGAYHEVYVKVDLNENDSLKECEIYKYEKQLAKDKKLNRLLEHWIRTKQAHRNISKIISAYGMKRIALYGFGVLGKLLYNELQNEEIDVKYILDQRADTLSRFEERIRNPIRQYERVDAVIITTIDGYDEICTLLKSQGYKTIITIEEIIDGAKLSD